MHIPRLRALWPGRSRLRMEPLGAHMTFDHRAGAGAVVNGPASAPAMTQTPRRQDERRDASGPDTTVVVATRNRASRVIPVLHRLAALPEAPPIIVVDNASDDDTAGRIA